MGEDQNYWLANDVYSRLLETLKDCPPSRCFQQSPAAGRKWNARQQGDSRMRRIKKFLIGAPGAVMGLFLLIVNPTNADIYGDFSRANCFTHNESITFRLLDPYWRSVISVHYPQGTYPDGDPDEWDLAGDKDPYFCSNPPCPTSPGGLETALCEVDDNCLWLATQNLSGRWAAIHKTNSLDSEPSGTWTVLGGHTKCWYFYGIPICEIDTTGPETDCNL